MSQDAHGDALETLRREFEQHKTSFHGLSEALSELLDRQERSASAALSPFTDLLQQLCTSPDEASALQALGTAASRLLPESTGSILLQEDDDEPRVAAAWDSSGSWTEESLPRPLLERLGELPADQALRLSLVSLGIKLGELRIWGPNIERVRAQLLVSAGGLALGALGLKRRLAARTVRDALTGLFNRRYMEDTLSRELHRARRHGSELGVILLDLDRFGEFNERYGNDTGDLMLQSVAGLLQASFRGSDVCCRSGGQRFAVILPEASLANTERRARELVQLIGELGFTRRGEPVQPVSACAGVASYPQHADSTETLMGAADSALYLAKQAGPGEVRVAEKLE